MDTKNELVSSLTHVVQTEEQEGEVRDRSMSGVVGGDRVVRQEDAYLGPETTGRRNHPPT